jgi:hypothetical protein
MSEIQLQNPTLYEHFFSNYLTSVRFGIVHYLVIKIYWIECVSALTTRKAQSLRSGQTININNL